MCIYFLLFSSEKKRLANEREGSVKDETLDDSAQIHLGVNCLYHAFTTFPSTYHYTYLLDPQPASRSHSVPATPEHVNPLILLSFNKFLRAITVVYTLAEIVEVDTANHCQVTVTVWAHNGHFDVGFVFLAAAATLFVLLWFPFTIFLLLGPCLQRYNHRRGLKWVGKMTPFLDAYYGPFKEKHRHWVGVLLLARVAVIIPTAIPYLNTGVSLLTVAILTAFLLFYTASVGGIYKKNYQSVLEDSFLVNLIMFSALLSHSNKTQYIAAYISFVHVVLVLLAVIIHQVYQRMKCRNEVPCAQVFKWSSVSRREYQDIDDGLMSNR